VRLERGKLFVPASVCSADELLVIAFREIRKTLKFLSETLVAVSSLNSFRHEIRHGKETARSGNPVSVCKSLSARHA
jgi:hypothetical protein